MAFDTRPEQLMQVPWPATAAWIAWPSSERPASPFDAGSARPSCERTLRRGCATGVKMVGEQRFDLQARILPTACHWRTSTALLAPIADLANADRLAERQETGRCAR